MQLDIVQKIRNNPPLHYYLKFHSYWYKELMRNPASLKELELEMKQEYKLTASDKISDISNKITLVRSFLDILK